MKTLAIVALALAILAGAVAGIGAVHSMRAAIAVHAQQVQA